MNMIPFVLSFHLEHYRKILIHGPSLQLLPPAGQWIPQKRLLVYSGEVLYTSVASHCNML